METAMRECPFCKEGRREGRKRGREGRKRRIYPRNGNGNGNGLVRYTCTFGDLFLAWRSGVTGRDGGRERSVCVCVFFEQRERDIWWLLAYDDTCIR
jgi:hypothetical protein